MRELPEQVMGRLLVPGEKLLWAGVPPTGLIMRPADRLLIPFGLFLCGFAAFWGVSVIGAGAPTFFLLWLIPVAAGGLYTLLGRSIVDAWRRTNTYYGVTDQRVIIASGSSGSNIESLNLDTLDDMKVSEQPDGRGTIMFHAPPPVMSLLSPRPGDYGRVALFPPAGPLVPSFEGIENVRLVYDAILRAKQRP